MNDILKNISLILEADRLGIQASEIKKLLENIEKYALKRIIQELDNISTQELINKVENPILEKIDKLIEERINQIKRNLYL